MRAIILCKQPFLRFISRFGRFYEDLTLTFTLSLSIPFTSLSLSLLSFLSLPLYISPSTFLSLSLLLSLFSLSFSLAYLMDVFVLVFFMILQETWSILTDSLSAVFGGTKFNKTRTKTSFRYAKENDGEKGRER